MYDCFNRSIDYLRVSVTDRCNLRCRYCMPAEGIKLLPRTDILSFDEITETVQYGIQQGIKKVRLTGGEPLVRNDIVTLVSMLSKLKGISDLAMTTNGTLLPQFAKRLADAGLQRVNISLDTLNPETFKYITRQGNLTDVLNGMDAAEKAGLFPIKINCVINKSPDEPDAIAVGEFGKQRGFDVRFIRKMDLKTGEFYPVHGGTGGDCSHCNRLRLTANGYLKPCLFGDIKFNVRQLGVQKAYQMALAQKPLQGQTNAHDGFYNIGG